MAHFDGGCGLEHEPSSISPSLRPRSCRLVKQFEGKKSPEWIILGGFQSTLLEFFMWQGGVGCDNAAVLVLMDFTLMREFN